MQDTMPLKDMETYTGQNDPPKDFDEFWDNNIKQLSTTYNYKLTPQNFNLPMVNCFELTFEGTNGASIYAKCIFPKSDTAVPVVFNFHGYMGQSSDWSTLLQFPAAGLGIVAMDTRGQSGKSTDGKSFRGNTVKGQVIRGAIDGKDNLFFKDVYLDVYQLVEIISEQSFVDENKLYSYGGSQGGALSLVAAALNPRITSTVAIYPFLSDFKRILELGDQSEPYDEFFRYFKFSDPFHRTEQEILNTLSYIDIKNMAHRIKGKVKLITGLEDNVCFPSTQFAIYNRLNCPKEHLIMPEYGHEDMHVHVNDYVMNWLSGSTINIRTQMH
ncbi:acetylxylan esterase [Companilactobacillus nodensis]|uniref:Cephalosporin-C deacetylase n=1 Tax=Companilactobacillus nodensis DSM 19682 = JCM 14932 = NBRC 107160 TaxID=1423775 RepID=A0A0R1KCM3_9LACO|nr:acetylxylan esterase [Companilactobacillus nodensis]KRK81115.1 cephalosporin-C deacetylase [Companilactobacillus nodensis DSM 19682 = JCM 14932 = NBRC 107160]